MPRVVVATAYGGPEVLTVEEQPVAAPGPGEVVLEVRAAGVNPIDWKLYSGAMGADPAALPRRVGFEAAGVVVAVGPGAEGPAGPVTAGDEVVAFRVTGAYAEQLVVPAGAVVPKPAELSFAQAGGLMLAGATAVHLLEATRVAAGDVVLVHAAAGGVGRLLVQLARLRGARVIGTARGRNHDPLRALGVEPVAYGDGLEARVRELAPDGVDVALDCVGTDEALDVSLALVADRDRIATIANAARGTREHVKVLGGGPGGDPGTEVRDAARPTLTALAARGELDVLVTPFPLADVADVHREARRGHAQGKLVLVP